MCIPDLQSYPRRCPSTVVAVMVAVNYCASFSPSSLARRRRRPKTTPTRSPLQTSRTARGRSRRRRTVTARSRRPRRTTTARSLRRPRRTITARSLRRDGPTVTARWTTAGRLPRSATRTPPCRPPACCRRRQSRAVIHKTRSRAVFHKTQSRRWRRTTDARLDDRRSRPLGTGSETIKR